MSNNQNSNSSKRQFDLTKIAIEEAAKMKITLTPQESTTIWVAPNATENEAREAISPKATGR